jgi:hypothetical protein
VQRAHGAGRHVGALCDRIEQRRHRYAAREILGVLSLVKRHGIAWIEACCKTAIERDVDGYRVVARGWPSDPTSRRRCCSRPTASSVT